MSNYNQLSTNERPKKELPGRRPGGTQSDLLTAASSRT